MTKQCKKHDWHYAHLWICGKCLKISFSNPWWHKTVKKCVSKVSKQEMLKLYESCAKGNVSIELTKRKEKE